MTCSAGAGGRCRRSAASSGARITIAQWLTPKKRVIQQRGLTPEIEVEQPQEGDDVQLRRALAYLRDGR